MLLGVDQIEIFGAGIRSFHNERHPSIMGIVLMGLSRIITPLLI